VAYSVHDLEDGLHAGLVTLKNLKDHSERTRVSQVARAAYCPQSWHVSVAELESVFAEFMELPCWRFGFDGGPASLPPATNPASELGGRFCPAAEEGTLTAAGRGPLTRYGADLVV